MTPQDVPLPRWRFVLPALVVSVALYAGVLHPWLMNWGATQVEVAAALPGDELAPGGSAFFTRGITIAAPPSVVWPWILQIGQDRAGFYSYTWLENMTGANIHNAGRVHAEWQARAIGDHVPLARPDLLGGRLKGVSQTEIVALEPERMIANAPGRFVLRSAEGNTTRLLIRESLDSQGPAVTRWLAWDPMHFVMVQRMLRGIKERAEGRPLVPAWRMLAARLGWVLAGVGTVFSFLARRRWRPWLSLPLAAALPALYGAGDWDAASAAIVAVGITALGELAFGHRWWPAYSLLAAGVLLVLLLAPEAYVAFGVTFIVAGLLALVVVLRQGDGKGQAAES